MADGAKANFIEANDPEALDVALMGSPRAKALSPHHCGLVFFVDGSLRVMHWTDRLKCQLHSPAMLAERDLAIDSYHRRA